MEKEAQAKGAILKIEYSNFDSNEQAKQIEELIKQDADLDAIKRIIKGTQLMTVFKNSRYLEKIAIDTAIKLVIGESIDISDRIYNGKTYVP